MSKIWYWISMYKEFRRYVKAQHTPVDFRNEDANMAYKQGYANGYSVGNDRGFHNGWNASMEAKQ